MLSRSGRLLACVFIGAAGAAAPLSTRAQASSSHASARRGDLGAFLRRFVARDAEGEPPDTTLRYVAATAKLGPPGTPAATVVFLIGRWWCGSGGCHTLALVPTDSGYRVIGQASITHPPVRLLASTHHGWHDLAVVVQGGGQLTPRRSLVRFDGTAYESNPSVAPETRRAGRVLIGSYAPAHRLYR